MSATLEIRNFGPVKEIKLTIGKYNILIGPQASGKSTISKVLCIIHMYEYRLSAITKGSFEKLKPLFEYYKIANYYQKDTYWYFEDEFLTFELNNGNFSIQNNHPEGSIYNAGSYYFPAERIALPMISDSLFELNLNDSSLPKYFLKFGRDFTIARNKQKLFNIPLLDIEFEPADGKNIVIHSTGKSLLLEETSSAIQANLAMLVILQNPVETPLLFVIEELELHSFPQLQKKLFYYLVERMKHPNLIHAYVMLPTHSPYLLSAVNNLLFAAKVGNTAGVEMTKRIIPQKAWIERGDFSAYFVENGKATSIVDEKTGLIHENMLDDISEDLAEEFDALMNIYKPVIA